MLFKIPSFMPNHNKLSTNHIKQLLLHANHNGTPSAAPRTFTENLALLQSVQYCVILLHRQQITWSQTSEYPIYNEICKCLLDYIRIHAFNECTMFLMGKSQSDRVYRICR